MLILGIDTGGTYTDSVILDRDRGKVLCKAKALTTPHDLTVGIEKCMRSDYDWPRLHRASGREFASYDTWRVGAYVRIHIRSNQTAQGCEEGRPGHERQA